MNCIHPTLAVALPALPQSYAASEPTDKRPAAELPAPLGTGIMTEQQKALHPLYAAAALGKLTYLQKPYNHQTQETAPEHPSTSHHLSHYFHSQAAPFRAIADVPELIKLPPGDSDPHLHFLSLPPKQQARLWERACPMLFEERKKIGSLQ